jgi:glyceraldehyde 3-phosphate dehydrogenase
MDKIRIGINGFGRIGRTLFRLLIDHPEIEVVAVNDLAPAATLAHLLKYDSIHGVSNALIQTTDNAESLLVNGRSIAVINEASIAHITWKKHHIDILVEATGKFKSQTALQKHLEAGAKRVILAAPPEDDHIPMVVMGVNEQIIKPSDLIVSNASCTTNNAAPMMAVIHDLCGISEAYITTVHSYTSDQSLHDQPHKDLRRSRAAGQSIIPTTTGAAKALTKIFPDLSNAIGGCGIRVPVPNGSLTDITFNVRKETSIQEINATFKRASLEKYHKILSYTEDPIVSVDLNNSPYSCVFDAQMTSVIGNMVKIIGWYDNETGYSNRLIDLIIYLNQNKK